MTMTMTMTTLRIMRNRSTLIRVALFTIVSTMLAMPVVDVDAFAFITVDNNMSGRATGTYPNSNANVNANANANTKTCDSSVLHRRRRSSSSSSKLCAVATDGDDATADANAAANTVGLYKKFADHAMERLLETEWLLEDDSVPSDLSKKEAAARGSKNESIVRITTKALVPKITKKKMNNDDDDNDNESSKPLVRYARITLLETVPVVSDSDNVVSPDGIQVLNFVVLPNADTTLPVLGIDLVSLPGSKHLLLLDAQPMVAGLNPHESHWEEWYKTHVSANGNGDYDDEEPLKFAWGGDFPETVKQYVSKYALWTRLQNIPEKDDTTNNDDETTTATSITTTTTTPAIDAIQGDIFVAFQAHLDAYLELLGRYADDIETVEGDNHQPSYLDYRRNNDPAKPMLNALYGAEWTQTLLDNVLFPQD